MSSNNRALLIGAMAALAVGMGAPRQSNPIVDPPVIAIRRTGTALDLLMNFSAGGPSTPRYIKRPLGTTAQDKRRARKARNVRRHKLAMKRRGAR